MATNSLIAWPGQLDPDDPNSPMQNGGKAPSPLPKPFQTNDPAFPGTPAPTATTAPVASVAQMPAGMDPALWNIYKDSGLTPSNDRGTGFADWQYWQGVGPSQYDRLKADIAGTGTDQPTGTPGSGAWSSSGAADRARGAVGGNGFMTPGAASTSVPFDFAPSVTKTDPRTDPFYQSLIARSSQSLNVDPNDPIIKGQVDAFRGEQTRAGRDAMSAAAEKGGATANQDAINRSTFEKEGQATSAYQAQLMGNEIAARRQEIQAALNGEQGVLTAAQQAALQEELAQLDVRLRSYQFGQSQNQQESQFARTLAQRAFESDSQNQFLNSPLYGG